MSQIDKSNPTTEQVKRIMARHNLSNEQASKYLGIPVHTLIKWLNGTRQPASSAARLVEVLGTIEALAPFVHDQFLPR